MRQAPLCFVVMPFRPELNYFYLYISKYLKETHGLRVERGDHRILTKALMDKIRDQILESDVILGDITSGNPNVFYELGLANAYGKPIIFLTQDAPKDAPVDVRQFEFIQYTLHQHDDFLKKLDNAIQNVFVEKYRSLYQDALNLLKQFNADVGFNHPSASQEEFQARVMRGEQTQDIPPVETMDMRAEFLLPKIIRETTDVATMKRMMDWINSGKYSKAASRNKRTTRNKVSQRKTQ